MKVGSGLAWVENFANLLNQCVLTLSLLLLFILNISIIFAELWRCDKAWLGLAWVGLSWSICKIAQAIRFDNLFIFSFWINSAPTLENKNINKSLKTQIWTIQKRQTNKLFNKSKTKENQMIKWLIEQFYKLINSNQAKLSLIPPS